MPANVIKVTKRMRLLVPEKGPEDAADVERLEERRNRVMMIVKQPPDREYEAVDRSVGNDQNHSPEPWKVISVRSHLRYTIYHTTHHPE